MPDPSTIPTIVVTAPQTQAPAAAPKPANTGGGGSVTFHDVLSALNPLQYLPVVGTIYRAVTGDTIPEGLRLAGSLLVGGLMGGPVGLFTTIAATIAEKVTGIDPDKIAHTVLADVGLAAPAGHQASVPTASNASANGGTGPPAATPVRTQAAPSIADWTEKGLTAAGVTVGSDGALSYKGASGADALNQLELGQLELGRIRVATAAYAHTAALH